MTAAPAPTRDRPWGEWRLAVVLCLLLAVFIVATRWLAWRDADHAARERLQAQARAVDENLSLQLQGVAAALRSMRSRLDQWPAETRADNAGRRMRALAESIPGVHAMTLLDADGTVVAASDTSLDGRDRSAAAAFRRARAGGDADVVYVAPPETTADGLFTVEIAIVMTADRGGFGGVVTAALAPDYLALVLESLHDAPDMWSALVHGEGRVMLVVPRGSAAPGLDLAQPESLFSRHLAAGTPATLLTGTAALTGEPRLMAQRTLRPAGLRVDAPLVVAVSRDLAAVHAPFWRQSAVYGVLYALFVAAVALTVHQRRQRLRAVEQAEAAHAERQRVLAQRLELALQGADLAFWDLDVRSGRTTVNDRWSTMLGHRPGDVATDTDGWRALLHPDDAAAVWAAQQAHLEGRTELYEVEYRLRHRDGRWVWVLDRGRVVERDADGAPRRMVGTHMDISARVLAEQALRRSEQSLAITLHSIGDAVVATDAQGRIERMNATAERLTGWSAADALGQPLGTVVRLVDGRTRAPVPDPARRVLDSGHAVGLADDTQLLARDGREYVVADSAAPIRTPEGEVVGVVLVFSDVTERHRAELALRDRERLLSAIANALPGPVSRVDRDGRYLFANAAYERWFGRRGADVVGRTQREVLGPYYAKVEPYVARALAGETVRYEGPVRTPEGLLHALVTLLPDVDADGRIQGHFTVATDITQLKQAQQRMRATQDDLEATLAAVPDLLFEIGLDGRIHSHHSPRRDLLVAPLEQQLGRTVPEVLPPDAAAVVMDALHQAHVHGHSTGLQYRLTLPQGGEHWFELSVACKPGPSGEVPRFVVLVRDISERMRVEHERAALERQLREAHKMESIGTLAGGIAHDFNNILAAILGNVQLARDDVGADHPAQASLEHIQKAGLRARELVQQILSFSRRQLPQLRRQPLQPVVEETLRLLRATLPAGVELQRHVSDVPLEVDADATQLQQVLLNLCTNAWHALPASGGRIEVGLEAVEVDPAGDARLRDLSTRRCAHLWVRDNGSGMDTATLERVFEPFFTTKPVGQGTGLGLSVAHGIVRAHRGAIVVDSAPGAGSTFHLYLPRATTLRSAPAGDAGGTAPARGTGQHVLYVDDDEVMGVMVERLLERAGFRTTVCASGMQALQRLDADLRDVDIVVSDHNMPQMSGLALCREIAARRPGLPLILTSGYVPEALRAEAAQAGVHTLLNKEHTVEQLVARVQQALGVTSGAH